MSGQPAPPVVGKVTHNSIQLYWEQDNPEKQQGARRQYCIQESEEDQDGKSKGFGNVFTGYANEHYFQGLEPMKTYQYRLRISSEDDVTPWSPIITVTTTKPTATSEDLHQAIRRVDLNTVQDILQESGESFSNIPDHLGLSPLMIAAEKGDVRIVEELLKFGADVNFTNSNGKDSVMIACYHGNKEAAEILVKHGGLWKRKDNGGSSALHWAVVGEHPEVVKWLLEIGSEIHDQDDSGWSALLRLATCNGRTDIARILVDHGAQVNQTDNAGKTSLMAVALNGNLSLCKLLVENGADPLYKNEFNNTALDFAVSFERKDVVEYLSTFVQSDS